MKNQAFIKLLSEDDTKYVDLNEFGVTLIRGWREALLTPAPVKSYVGNDSRLEHGISMVATADCAKVNQREIDLPMFLEGETEDDYLDKLEKLFNKIAYSGEICMKVPVLKRVFKFVYSQCTKFGDYGLKKGNFTLKLVEPNPKDRLKI